MQFPPGATPIRLFASSGCLRAIAKTSFHQFSVFAASRGEGLHPMLGELLERANGSPFSEVSRRGDGMVQARPNPDSEIVLSRANVVMFSR
jgi:hypothetical protein